MLLSCVSTTPSDALNAIGLLARWIGAPDHYGRGLRLYTLLRERGLLDPSGGVFWGLERIPLDQWPELIAAAQLQPPTCHVTVTSAIGRYLGR